MVWCSARAMFHPILLAMALLLVITFQAQGQTAPMIGIDANYALDMAARERTWRDQGQPIDPYALLGRNGVEHARIRLWVGDEGMNRLNYATQTAQRATRAGLKPYVVIFLSEEWADFVKQPAPTAWRGLSLDEKARVVRDYSERVTRHFMAQGLAIDTYAIGNEIDFGICGEFEEQWPRRVSVEYMRSAIWPRAAQIIKASQAGVLAAQPQAKFVIHLTQWNKPEYGLAFRRTMIEAGVRVDIPGLSYFPSSAKEPAERELGFLQAQVATIQAALGKPVLICETGYPAVAQLGGQFADWNLAASGYPLNEEGQARWLADLTKLVRSDRRFSGLFYWSPEWYDGGIWDAFAMYDAQGASRASVRSMAQPK